MAVLTRRTGPLTREEVTEWKQRLQDAVSDSERLRVIKDLDERLTNAGHRS